MPPTRFSMELLLFNQRPMLNHTHTDLTLLITYDTRLDMLLLGSANCVDSSESQLKIGDQHPDGTANFIVAITGSPAEAVEMLGDESLEAESRRKYRGYSI